MEACHVTGQRPGKAGRAEANHKQVIDNTGQALGREGGNEFTWDCQRSSISVSEATHIVPEPVDIWWGYSPGNEGVLPTRSLWMFRLFLLFSRSSRPAQNFPEVALPPDQAGNMPPSCTTYQGALGFQKEEGSKAEKAV